MRTMFIPTTLLLLCSLAQFAIAVEWITVEGCSSPYICYAPKKCLADRITSMETSNVVEVSDPTDPFAKDCDVLLRYYIYEKHWVYVSLESFKEVSQIIVRQQHKLAAKRKPDRPALFYCDENVAKYNDKPRKIDKNSVPSKLAKFQCAFAVKLKKGETVFDEQPDLEMRFETSTGKTKWSSITFNKNEGCNPNNLLFIKDVTSNKKVYDKVAQKPGYWYCKRDGFELEYKNADGFEIIKKSELSCVAKNYVVKDAVVGESIYIRCVADAQYFCNYTVLATPGKTPLKTEPGDANSKITSTLTCPPGKKFLVIKDTPILKYEFTCLNYGGTELWTVVDLDRNITYKLSKTGPETYCTNELECHRMNRIPDSAIPDGFLNSSNLPQCHTDGVLRIGEKEVSKIRCDLQSGKYKYLLKEDKEEKDVHKEIIFNCTYAALMDEEKNKANEKVVLTTLISSVSITILGGLAIIIATIFISNARIKKMKREAEQKLAEDEIAGNKYCRTDAENKLRAEHKALRDKENAARSLKKDPDHEHDKVQEEKTAPLENLSKWSEQTLTMRASNKKILHCNDVAGTKNVIEDPAVDFCGDIPKEIVAHFGGMSQTPDNVPEPSPLRKRLSRRFLKRFNEHLYDIRYGVKKPKQ